MKTPGKKQTYDHAKIKSLIRAGKENRAIAEDANCPYNTVVYVRRKMGIVQGRWGGPYPSIDVPKIKELYSTGVPVAQIAKKMKCSKTTVYRWLQLKKHSNEARMGIIEDEACQV